MAEHRTVDVGIACLPSRTKRAGKLGVDDGVGQSSHIISMTAILRWAGAMIEEGIGGRGKDATVLQANEHCTTILLTLPQLR